MNHRKVLAILNLVVGGLGACAGFLALAVFWGLAFVAALAGEASAAGAFVLFLLGLFVGGLVLALHAPALVGGLAMLRGREWADAVVLIASVLNLLSFPYGTALGVYGLWVLFSEEASARPGHSWAA